MQRKQLIPRLAMAVAVVAGAALAVALPTGAQAGPGLLATHAGMTWHVRAKVDGLINVGADEITNAYQGDAPPTTSLPILCLNVDGSPVPTGITLDEYNGWARGTVGVTPAVAGRLLTSLDVANAICVRNFGPGWRMAEHHDGWFGGGRTGWHFWARAQEPIDPDIRFWTYINDQPANCWASLSSKVTTERTMVRRLIDGRVYVVNASDTNPQVPQLMAEAISPMFLGLGPMYPPGSATTPSTLQVTVNYSDGTSKTVIVNDLSLSPPTLRYVTEKTIAIGHPWP